MEQQERFIKGEYQRELGMGDVVFVLFILGGGRFL
jgi:hypothetical protein